LHQHVRGKVGRDQIVVPFLINYYNERYLCAYCH
jgi:hypothetical protein